MNWYILFRANSIQAGGNICNFCLEEKLQILPCFNFRSNLNKRSEHFTKCLHASRFYAGGFKRKRVSKQTANRITKEHNRINSVRGEKLYTQLKSCIKLLLLINALQCYLVLSPLCSPKREIV